MATLKKCPICKKRHRKASMYNKCVRRKTYESRKKCSVCGIKHRKQRAINRCKRRADKKKASW